MPNHPILESSHSLEADPPADTAPGYETPGTVLDTDEIAKLAYSYWESRGYAGGSAQEDWFRAEDELRQRAAEAMTKSATA
jgi:hypothetical protein